MTHSKLVRRFVRKRGVKNRPEPALVKCGCGFSPILASSFDVGMRVKLFWFECPNDACDSEPTSPVKSVREAAAIWNATQAAR
jgi:hypothetical protein